MSMRQKPRWLIYALTRLHEKAELLTIRDERGRVQLQGHPTPGDVEKELVKAYRYGRSQGTRKGRR